MALYIDIYCSFGLVIPSLSNLYSPGILTDGYLQQLLVDTVYIACIYTVTVCYCRDLVGSSVRYNDFIGFIHSSNRRIQVIPPRSDAVTRWRRNELRWKQHRSTELWGHKSNPTNGRIEPLCIETKWRAMNLFICSRLSSLYNPSKPLYTAEDFVASLLRSLA